MEHKGQHQSEFQINNTSSGIDPLDQANIQTNHWLRNDLKKIIEPLAVLRFIPDLIKELKHTIVRQFTNLLTGQVEADVISRQANIKVLNKKIESTDRYIKQKEENLNKTIERINERYTILSNQLNQEHETFLRKLDSHAYDIIEKIYPKQIQEKFSYDSLPGIDFLSEHAMLSVNERCVCLDQGMKDALKEVSSFMEKRQLFYHQIEDFECRHLDEGTYELPWCFVEFKNRKSGETRFECWFECELESGRKNNELNELRAEIEFLAENLNPSRIWIDDLLKEMKGFLEDKLPGSERKRFLSDFFPNQN
jgi:uncharacterized protein Smg (DUF494 family)